MPDEYISREAAIKYAEHAYHEWNLAMAAADGKRGINLVYKRQELCKAVESVFRDMPAADVAPVVRCKDCKWFADNNGGEWYGCKMFQVVRITPEDAPNPDDFCSYGEYRTNSGGNEHE